jgi:hypothetical protein
MIKFSRIGKMGRLGNCLFQIAFIHSMAKKYNCEYVLPEWKYKGYFDFKHPIDTGIKSDINIREPEFHYTPEYYSNYTKFYKIENINFSGYFQSYKYFSSREDILELFKFNEEFKQSVYEKVKPLLNKPIVAIHIRYGDYIGNDNYINVSRNYYSKCIKLFGKYCRFVVLTDDYTLARQMLNGLDVDFSLEGMSDIEHLCFMVCFANHFILCNSTFGWWGAYLNQNKDKIVYRPERIFSGKLAAMNNEKDFWPSEWVIQNDDIFIYPMKDVTFIIPVKNDSKDRVENLELTVKFIRANFDTNIIIGEQGTHYFEYIDSDQYIWFDYPNFHRTRMLNRMTVSANTPIIINWDADVFVNPEQLYEAIKLIREGYDVVYPYDGTFIRMGRCFYSQLKNDIYLFNSFYGVYHNMSIHSPKIKSLGGAVCFNKEKYLEIGGENENFISHAPEDVERNYRIVTLGLKWGRVPGSLYHLDHWMGEDSTHNHEWKLINRSELTRVISMNTYQLRKYIANWTDYNQKNKNQV